MRLAKSGQRAQADEVKKLPKPSVPTYAINRLAREHGREVKALLRAGEELRTAQERGLAGTGNDLRAKVDAERRAVRALVDRARKLLEEEDRSASDATLERIAKTLHAAVADDEGRHLLEQGRLSKELEPRGFEALAGMVPARPPAKRRQSSNGAAARRKRVSELRQRVREARAEARALARDATAAERDAERAAEKAHAMRAKADEAARAVEEAEAELERA